MSQPRRQDEIDFYAALRARAAGNDNHYWGGRSASVAEFTRLGIPEGRAYYLLEKWYGKGWIECGTWVWGGWFTEDAPEGLDNGAKKG